MFSQLQYLFNSRNRCENTNFDNNYVIAGFISDPVTLHKITDFQIGETDITISKK